MRVLVAYMTSTGNTKKIAEAVYGEINCEKELKPIKEVQDIGAYDLAFFGFPTHAEGPDKNVKEVLAKHCTNGRKVALFVTHCAPENAPEVPDWMAKFKQAAAGADIVGFFDCQGQMSKGVKLFLSISPKKKFRTWAKKDNSQGQPDEARLEKARTFARETLSRMD
jgi:flavodoxin